VFPAASDDAFKLWMQQGFSTADDQNTEAKAGQLVYPFEHEVLGNRRGKVIKFIAIGAGEITPSHRDNMSQQRMTFGSKPTDDEPKFTYSPGSLNVSRNYDAPSIVKLFLSLK
jgi:hypothetical protein